MKKSIIFISLILILATACGKTKTTVNNTETTEESSLIIETTEKKEVVTNEEGTLNIELADMEEKAKVITDFIEKEAETQSQLNEKANELYKLWDVEINDIWKRIKAKETASKFKALNKEEVAWVSTKEKRRKEIKILYGDGTIEPMEEDLMAAEMTRERCYYLAAYLGNLIGETVNPLKVNIEGRYVDTQGTGQEVYSDLVVKKKSDGTYDTTICIYRLCTLAGSSTEKDGVLEFTGKDPNENTIKGEITFLGTTCTFKVTDSTWTYLKNGDTFDFVGKWDLNTLNN